MSAAFRAFSELAMVLQDNSYVSKGELLRYDLYTYTGD